MDNQYTEVQQDIRNRFYTVLRDHRINDESSPDRALTTPLLERATRSICVSSLEELAQFTDDFKQFLSPGNLAFFPDIINGETRMFLWVNELVMWQEIEISSSNGLGASPIVFKNNINVAEKGAVIHDLVLSWEIDDTVEFKIQTIDNGIGTIDNEARVKELTTANILEDTTWTLIHQNGRHKATNKTSLVFRNKIYWGKSTYDSVSEIEIKKLDNVLRADRHTVCNFNCSSDYIYIAIPRSMGIPKFVAYELWMADWNVTSLPMTNIHGQTEIYNIYRSENKQNGSNISIAIF
jgi:hypothetical protein